MGFINNPVLQVGNLLRGNENSGTLLCDYFSGKLVRLHRVRRCCQDWYAPALENGRSVWKSISSAL